MVARAAIGATLIAGALACGPARHGAAGGRAAPPPSRRATASAVVGDYTVVFDGTGELRVEAALDKSGASFTVERKAERWIQDFEYLADGDTSWHPGTRHERAFVASACAAARCRIRYRYRLREGAKALDDLELAELDGDLLEAPPSTWLLAPSEADDGARLRFRVSTPEGMSFVTGVFHAPDDDKAWEIAAGDVWTSPYSAFGKLRVRAIAVPGGRVSVAIAPGKTTVTEDDLVSWVTHAGSAIASYFAAFPIPEVLVLLVPSRGRWIGEGKTLSGGGASIFIRVGETAPVRALSDDWVLVHEMTHLAFPSVPRESDWAEEGLATYVEPFARSRAGLITAEAAWSGLLEGLPNGLPQAGDRGLDRTPTWGRKYWGGALFYALADVEIRKRTRNEMGLEHALRGILASGGNNTKRWRLDEAYTAGDAATKVPVLRALHDAMGTAPHPVDLEAFARELGVRRENGTVRFDDAAPLAAVRRAISGG